MTDKQNPNLEDIANTGTNKSGQFSRRYFAKLLPYAVILGTVAVVVGYIPRTSKDYDTPGKRLEDLIRDGLANGPLSYTQVSQYTPMAYEMAYIARTVKNDDMYEKARELLYKIIDSVVDSIFKDTIFGEVPLGYREYRALYRSSHNYLFTWYSVSDDAIKNRVTNLSKENKDEAKRLI